MVIVMVDVAPSAAAPVDIVDSPAAVPPVPPGADAAAFICPSPRAFLVVLLVPVESDIVGVIVLIRNE